MRMSDWSSDVCSSDLAVARGEAARHETGTRGRADRRRVVELRHHHAVAGERVDVRRRDQRVAGQRQVGKSHVVDQNEEDVRLPRRRARGRICWHGGRREAVSGDDRSEEHTSELQSLMRISYAVFCLKKNNTRKDYDNKNNEQTVDI